MKTGKLRITVALLIASFFLLAAHVDFGVSVGTLPPPPPVIPAPAPVIQAPGPAYVWVPGYWDWVNGRWVWVDGRWMLPPRPHEVWVEPAVDIRLHRGHWERRDRR
jgi:WXXGXW repeat (2 copies)